MNMRDFDELCGSRLRYLRPFIVLVSCLVMCCLNIKTQVPVNDALGRLLLTILVFYIIGTFAQNKVRKIVFEAEEAARKREEEEEKKAKELAAEQQEMDEDEEKEEEEISEEEENE